MYLRQIWHHYKESFHKINDRESRATRFEFWSVQIGDFILGSFMLALEDLIELLRKDRVIEEFYLNPIVPFLILLGLVRFGAHAALSKRRLNDMEGSEWRNVVLRIPFVGHIPFLNALLLGFKPSALTPEEKEQRHREARKTVQKGPR